MPTSDGEVETDIEAQATKTPGAETPPHEEEPPETPPPGSQANPSEPVHGSPTDAIEAFQPSGTPEQRELRREALRHVGACLRKRGRADRQDFESDLFPGASGAYDRTDDRREQVIRPGLETLPGVVAPEEGDDWRVTEGRDEMTVD